MASVLLSHVDNDRVAARALARLLEGAGHSVYSVDPDGPSFRSRENVSCVIVIWSAAAVVSPYVYEEARIALSRRCLVQVFTADFELSALRPVFRTQPLVSSGATEDIL